MRVIYLDMVFLINAGMDLLLLYLTGKIWGRRAQGKRLLFGAFLGGVWACLVTVNGGFFAVWVPEWLTAVLTVFVVSFGMLKIAYDIPKGAAAKYLVTLYGLTFLIGGGVDALYYHSSLGAYLRDRLYRGGGGPVSLPVLAAGAFLTAAGCLLVVRCFLPRWREPDIRTVCLEFRGKSILLRGLYDTGNRLADPYFGKPVHVLELEACAGILSEAEISYMAGRIRGEPETEAIFPVFSVPFRSVGESHGIMPAIFMDELRLEGEAPVRLERPLIGFVPHRLSEERQYQMILHPVTGAGRTKRTGGRNKHDFKGIDAGSVSVENDAKAVRSEAFPSGGCALYRRQ
ncbi:MAG: sigma-E processing peptidase SpoIIGA [Lachnospiraceae bacterium]|nr:sigma-E processing peptidase SpoIIGA [Lachnospiraceae bacterium]